MANTYTGGVFTVNTSTNVAGLTLLKGAPPDFTDDIDVISPAVLTIESGLSYRTIEGPVVVAHGVTLTPGPVATGLCTLADVYPLAGATSDTNGAIARLILAVSRAIRAHTGLSFGPVVAEERVVLVDGPTAYPRELRDLTSVEDVDGATVAVTEADTDMDGHIRWLELSYPMTGRLTIDGEWGWAAIPDDVVIYAAQTVADWYKRDQGVTMNALGDLSGDMTRRTRLLPPYVAEGLEHYCRR